MTGELYFEVGEYLQETLGRLSTLVVTKVEQGV